MYSIVIPVYRTADFVPMLIDALSNVARTVAERFGVETEVVFVVDASPDDSYPRLVEALPAAPFHSQLVLHSRNFGAFSAIRTGLSVAKGKYFGVVAADLQEPPELLVEFLERMVGGEYDVAVGVRRSRNDPRMSRAASRIFWGFYYRYIMPEMPKGGVDVFGCTLQVRDELLLIEEHNSSLIGLLLWLGYRRAEVPYDRRVRTLGKSAWTIRKKVKYMSDSIFSFTNIPIRMLTGVGILGLAVAVGYGSLVAILRLFWAIEIPGYAATVIIVSFFGGINALGIGIVRNYTWRAYGNTKRRPLSVVLSTRTFAPAGGKRRKRGG